MSVVPFTAEYGRHDTVQPGDVHHVVMTERPHTQPNVIVITHRGGAEPLFFDFSYPDGGSPMTENLAPLVDNSFVVMPGQEYRVAAFYQVTEVAVCSAAPAHYSVQSIW